MARRGARGNRTSAKGGSWRLVALATVLVACGAAASLDGDEIPNDSDEASDVPLCELGMVRCNDASLERCVATGWIAVAACVNAALCQATPIGQCLAPECSEGQFSCSRGLLRVCSRDRTGWNSIEQCASAEVCDPMMRRCL